VVIEHSALWTERSENPADVKRDGSRDERQIASNARVIHGKDIEATKPP
jgi:hypothetical protein